MFKKRKERTRNTYGKETRLQKKFKTINYRLLKIQKNKIRTYGNWTKIQYNRNVGF